MTPEAMSHDLRVELHGGEGAGHRMRFDPGSTLSGRVRFTPDRDLRCIILVRLRWYTQGRGDPDGEEIAEMNVFQGTLQRGIPTAHDFEFALPREPWSFTGHLIRIIWEFEAEVEVAFAFNPKVQHVIVLAPPGRRIWSADEIPAPTV
jgi:hypothetical protein